MDFLYLKAIHIVFVVSWFAALFYIVRLFIYTTEAQEKPKQEKLILTAQLLVMQRRLFYIIGWPALVGTYVFGTWMIVRNPLYLDMPWMRLKLVSVFLLTFYHIGCQLLINEQGRGVYRFSSFALRLLNELATIFLVAIVFLAVVKSTESLWHGVAGIIILGILLMLAATLYKRSRQKKDQP